MIQYDPKDWLGQMVTVRGSVLGSIIVRVLIVTAFAAGVVGLRELYRFPALPAAPHALLGAALGLLLVFRTNASYDRFWEGRKKWGMIVNRARDLARQTLGWIEGAPELKERIVRHTIAFAVAAKRELRGERCLDELGGVLAKEDIDALLAADHMPLRALEEVTRSIARARAEGALSDLRANALDLNVTQLIDELGGCERILKTPMPLAYVLHTKRFLALFCFTLPFALVQAMGWLSVPCLFVVTWALLGIEEIGVQIEDPFGHDPNDLPLDDICLTIERNLLEMLARAHPSRGGGA